MESELNGQGISLVLEALLVVTVVFRHPCPVTIVLPFEEGAQCFSLCSGGLVLDEEIGVILRQFLLFFLFFLCHPAILPAASAHEKETSPNGSFGYRGPVVRVGILARRRVRYGRLGRLGLTMGAL